MGGPFLTVGAIWIAPAGHGSHSPTICTPPAGRAPQPGGLSRKNLEKQQFPRLVAQPEELDLYRSVYLAGGWRAALQGIPLFGSVGCHPTRCATSILRIQHNFQLVKVQDFPILVITKGFRPIAV